MASSSNVFPAGVKPFAERKFPKAICMFDVDGTLTPARLGISKEMAATLRKLREYTAVAFVGGSDLVKITEQLQVPGEVGECFFAIGERGGS
jgi:phosphomannomutase